MIALFTVWLFVVCVANQPQYAGAGFSRTATLHVSFAVLFLIYAAVLLGRRGLPSSLPIDGAVCLVLLTLAVSAVTSINRVISTEVVLLPAAVVLSLYAIYDFKALTAERLMRVLIAMSMLLSLFAFLMAFIQSDRWWQLSADVDGSMSWMRAGPPRSGGLLHPNVLAMILNLVLPFALLLLLRPRGRVDRPFAAVAVVIIVLAMFITQSRGAWLAGMAGLGGFGGLLLLSGRAKVSDLLRRLPWRPLLLGGGVAAVVLAGGIVVTWESRPPWLFRDTISLRQEAVARALDIFEDRPVFGTGANTYGLRYDAYGGEHLSSNVHPHNAYVNALVDSGIVGALLLLGAAVIVGGWLTRSYLSASPEKRAVLAACISGLVTLPVHGLADSPQLWTPVLVVVAVVLAIALRTAPLESGRRRFVMAPRLLIAGLLPLLLFGWLSFDLTHQQYQRSQELQAAGSLQEASRVASEAASSWTAGTATHLNAGIIAGLLYQDDPTDVNLKLAIGHFDDAIASDPNSAIGYANRAQLELERGLLDEAAADAAIAVAKARHDPAIAAVAATVLEAAGRTEEAVSAYALALAKEPRLAQSLFWQSTPQRLALRPLVIAASGVDACDQGLAAVLYGAYGDDLEVLLAGCEDRIAMGQGKTDDGVSRVLLLSALGRTEAAIAGGRELVRTAPAVTGSRMALGVALSATGDLRAVRNELLLATGNRDARLLLSYTFDGGASGRNQVSPVLSLVAGPEPLPASVRNMIDATRSPAAGFAQRGDYTAEEKYFEIDLLRSAPSVMLLPGEWEKLISPREAGFDDVLALR